MALAKISFPVPVSPVNKIEKFVSAAFLACFIFSKKISEEPINVLKEKLFLIEFSYSNL